MPTYEYECNTCGYRLEAFHSMSAKPLVNCPECRQPKLVKLISPGVAIIIRGTQNPCRGSKGGTTKKRRKPRLGDKLGEGDNKGKLPFWRDGSVNKKVLKNPEQYIKEGKVE